MRPRRGSRLVAAVAALFLAVSSVGACLYPRTAAAARDCCKKRCPHDARPRIQGCCCATPAAPVAAPSLPDASAAPVAWTVASTLSLADLPPRPLGTVCSHAPPGPPLFLQRCSLVL